MSHKCPMAVSGSSVEDSDTALTCFSCGAEGIRTPDPLHAMQVRYQLRHSPIASPNERVTTRGILANRRARSEIGVRQEVRTRL